MEGGIRAVVADAVVIWIGGGVWDVISLGETAWEERLIERREGIGILVFTGTGLSEGDGKVVIEIAVRVFMVCLMGRVHSSLVSISIMLVYIPFAC